MRYTWAHCYYALVFKGMKFEIRQRMIRWNMLFEKENVPVACKSRHEMLRTLKDKIPAKM